MAATKGINATALALVNTLTTYLPGELTTVSTAYGDSVPLPAPKKVFTFWRSLGQLDLAGYPVVVVSSLGGTVVTDGATMFQEMAHKFEVTALLRSNDLYTSEAQAVRYLEAIQQALIKHQRLDGTLNGVTGLTLSQYGKAVVYGEKPGSILGYNAGWMVTVRIEEQ